MAKPAGRKGSAVVTAAAAASPRERDDGAAGGPPPGHAAPALEPPLLSTDARAADAGAATAGGAGGAPGGRPPMKPSLAALIRRQASGIVGRMLRADAARAGGSALQKLTLAPGVAAKGATHAVCCQTLKYLPLLKDLLADVGLLAAGRGGDPALRRRPEDAYVCVYELLFGGGLPEPPTAAGEPSAAAAAAAAAAAKQAPGQPPKPADPAKAVLARKAALRSALARRLAAAGTRDPAALLPGGAAGPAAAGGAGAASDSADPFPRYVRVNTLRTDAAAAAAALAPAVAGGAAAIRRDALVPDLLVLPPGTALHAHALVRSGAVVLQGKSSCLPALALAPRPGWVVLDACAAPGNKTTHVAALMRNQGRVIALDADATRLERLRAAAAAAGASCIAPRHADFLAMDPCSAEGRSVRAVLLDPSCSGSGTARRAHWHLLPSARGGAGASPAAASSSAAAALPPQEAARLERLAAFQEAALGHALSFPCAERITYSTCSVHARENEQVVAAVLPAARRAGFELAPALPAWPHRGVPHVAAPGGGGGKGGGTGKPVARPGLNATEAACCLRVEASRDQTDGFFLALFVRRPPGGSRAEPAAGEAGAGAGPAAGGKRKRPVQASGAPRGGAPDADEEKDEAELASGAAGESLAPAAACTAAESKLRRRREKKRRKAAALAAEAAAAAGEARG